MSRMLFCNAALAIDFRFSVLGYFVSIISNHQAYVFITYIHHQVFDTIAQESVYIYKHILV